MPDPIVPIHKMNDHDGLFNVQIEGLSDMQQQLLGEPRTAAKKTYSSQTLNTLERIYKSKDELLSTAQSHLNRTAEDIEISNLAQKSFEKQNIKIHTNDNFEHVNPFTNSQLLKCLVRST